jgi:hypothetical protein
MRVGDGPSAFLGDHSLLCRTFLGNIWGADLLPENPKRRKLLPWLNRGGLYQPLGA